MPSISLRHIGFLLGGAILAVCIGFFWFTWNLIGNFKAHIAPADAIIVLTGKAPRIQDAITLLADRKGKKLLISGVNIATTKQTLRKRFSAQDRLFTCCVDIDTVAQNTRGNAAQSARWVKQNGFKSLILVTSAYHMPRSLLEFRHAMPDRHLTAFPLNTKSIPIDRWWAYPGTTQLLVIEYFKYLLAWVRLYTADPMRGRGSG